MAMGIFRSSDPSEMLSYYPSLSLPEFSPFIYNSGESLAVKRINLAIKDSFLKIDSEDDYISFEISLEEFSLWKREFERYEDLHKEISYKYCTSSNILNVKVMGAKSSYHEFLACEIAYQIGEQIRSIAKGDANDPSAKFARQIYNAGSWKVEARNGKIQEPDSSFYHVEAGHQTVAVEVAYSQDLAKLAERANTFIQHADVQTVIGLKLSYPMAKTASIFVWSAGADNVDASNQKRCIKTMIHNEIFYDMGKPLKNGKSGVDLSLADFVPRTLKDYPEEIKTRHIHIKFSDIVERIEIARRVAAREKPNDELARETKEKEGASRALATSDKKPASEIGKCMGTKQKYHTLAYASPSERRRVGYGTLSKIPTLGASGIWQQHPPLRPGTSRQFPSFQPPTAGPLFSTFRAPMVREHPVLLLRPGSGRLALSLLKKLKFRY